MKNSQSDRDNRSNQLNQNNDAYWQSRGHDEHPDKHPDVDSDGHWEGATLPSDGSWKGATLPMAISMPTKIID